MMKRILTSILSLSFLLMACSPDNESHQSEKKADSTSTAKQTIDPAKQGFTTTSSGFSVVKGVDWKKYDDGVAQAKKEKKYTFVKFYASWCGYCRKMQTEVLSDPEIQATLDKDFVSVLVNGESDEIINVMGKDVPEKILAAAHQVTGFPTLVFLDPEQKVIKKIPGYAPKETFREMLKYISTQAYKKELEQQAKATEIDEKNFQKQANGFAVAKGVNWKKYDAGVAEAKNSKKHTFVKFYASWCGYCRKMQKEVLSDPKIQAELEKNFVSILVDGESNQVVTANGKQMEEKALSDSHGVTGFPTLAFLDSNEKVIRKIPGFVPKETFYQMLTYISSEAYKKEI